VAREYLERQVRRNTAASTYRETARIIEQDVIPEWGKRSIGSIAKREVIALVDKKIAAGAEVQANRVLARLRTCSDGPSRRTASPSIPATGCSEGRARPGADM
jgi:hypothetical protein